MYTCTRANCPSLGNAREYYHSTQYMRYHREVCWDRGRWGTWDIHGKWDLVIVHNRVESRSVRLEMELAGLPEPPSAKLQNQSHQNYGCKINKKAIGVNTAHLRLWFGAQGNNRNATDWPPYWYETVLGQPATQDRGGNQRMGGLDRPGGTRTALATLSGAAGDAGGEDDFRTACWFSTTRHCTSACTSSDLRWRGELEEERMSTNGDTAPYID